MKNSRSYREGSKESDRNYEEGKQRTPRDAYERREKYRTPVHKAVNYDEGDETDYDWDDETR